MDTLTPIPNRHHLEEAIKHALDGDAILFLGAGFSLGATNIRNEAFKDATELAKLLLEKCSVTEEATLSHAAQYFIQELGSPALFELLLEQFTCAGVRDYHEIILSLPWKRIYTTNYDDVIDFCADSLGINIYHFSSDIEPRNFPSDGVVCHYINGRLKNGSEADLMGKIKLTNESYNLYGFNDSLWSNQFRSDIRSAKSILMVGYGLYDLDISKVLYAYDNLRSKTHFISSPQKNVVRDSVISPFGTIYSIGVQVFAGIVSEIRATYNPPKIRNYSYTSVLPFIVPEGQQTVTVELVDNLILYGQANTLAIANSLTEERRKLEYYVGRTVLGEVSSILSDAENKIMTIILTGGLANGKTMLSIGLACQFVERGFDVFTFEEVNDFTEHELDIICNSTNKTLLILEDFGSYINVVEHIVRSRGENFHLCLTTRSNGGNIDYGRIDRLFNVDEHLVIDVDKLSEIDIESFVNLCDQNALWGKNRAGESFNRKKNILQHECDSQLQPLLLSIIQSPDVDARVQELFKEVMKEKGLQEIVIVILSMQVLNLKIPFEVLAELLEVNLVIFNRLRQTGFAKHFLNYTSGNVTLNSGLVSRYLLKEKFQAIEVCDVLKKIAKKCHPYWILRPSGVMQDRVYNNLWRSLMRYSQLSLIVPENGFHEAISGYYESLRNLEGVEKEPHFWLQNALARMEFSDFVVAQRFFDTAFDLAASKNYNYDTTSIENAYAKFLLQRAIQKRPTTSFADFKAANNIILEQVKSRDNRTYALRIVRKLYLSYFKSVFSYLRVEHKNEYRSIIFETRKILMRAVNEDPLHTRFAVSDLSQVLDDIGEVR